MSTVKSERETMSDSELNLKIAEFLEPKPIFADYEYDHERSAWRWVPEVEDRKGNVIYRGELGPRDFVNDPACTLMLLTKLAEDDEVSIEELNGWYAEYNCGPNDGSERITARAATMGRAIAELFAKANNLI
jgi:hypothetical protein